MNAAQLVDRIAAVRPRAVELAETVSFAVLVEPALLRQARLQFMPDADAGVEADLWLSPLVKSRSTEGITFFPEVAALLRERIARNVQRSNDAWTLTSAERHKFLPPTLVLEERINHLSIDEREAAAREIDELLSSVLAAMAAGGRDGLASWAARALANLPTSVRQRSAEKVKMIAAGASLRLGIDPRPAIGGAMPDWLRYVAPAQLPVETVGVQLGPGALRVDASKEPAGQLLRLPATRPYLLDVSWTDASGNTKRVQLALRAGETRNVTVGSSEVRLRTVSGDTYEVRLGGTAPADVRHHIIDFSHMLARGDARYRADFSDSMTLVTAPPGAGKTYMLASQCRRWTEAGTACAYHFFESGTPKLEYWEFAERSLIAQLMTRYDAPPWAVTMRLPEFLRMIAPSVGTGPVYIVLDNVDVVQRHYTVSDVLGPLTALPPQFKVIASATVSAEPLVNPMVVQVIELKARRPSNMPELPPKGTAARRYLEAVAVARAPLALSDNDWLQAITGLKSVRIEPWTVLTTHLGEQCVTIVDEHHRTLIIEQMDDAARAHRELVEALESAITVSWYRIRHAAWHWLYAGNEGRAREILATTEWLEKSIKQFGASITADIIDEVRDATVRHSTA